MQTFDNENVVRQKVHFVSISSLNNPIYLCCVACRRVATYCFDSAVREEGTKVLAKTWFFGTPPIALFGSLLFRFVTILFPAELDEGYVGCG